MKRIVILTATRAEYGLLKPLIKKINDDQDFDMRLAVTGMHLSPEFGMTIREIAGDNLPIDKKIEILLSADTPVAISKSMGLAVISFAEYFAECDPDALVVLGDRYETLAVCCAAMNARVPIFHLNGGEASEGLIDEAVRHAVTKMSYLHFTSTEKYRSRVIQMGEEPSRVFNVGAMGVENALHAELLSPAELEESLEFPLGSRYAVGTFHPVTLERETAEVQTEELLAALDHHADMRYLFTKANSDADGRVINRLLENYEKEHDNFRVFDSLGMKRYLSALKYASFVIGNSSSGLMEAPVFGIPVIDIGDRQKGRIACGAVIHCNPVRQEIEDAIQSALSKEFRRKANSASNPYGDGNTSSKIIKIIRDYLLNDKVDIKKKFFDLDYKI